jgi:hypothetical protein
MLTKIIGWPMSTDRLTQLVPSYSPGPEVMYAPPKIQRKTGRLAEESIPAGRWMLTVRQSSDALQVLVSREGSLERERGNVLGSCDDDEGRELEDEVQRA